MAIRVVELVGPICVDPKDGQRLFEEIMGLLASGAEVEVDFSGVTTLTSSFLNQAIGRVFGEMPPAEVDRRLVFRGLDGADSSLLGLVRKNAIRFYGAGHEERETLTKIDEKH